jgi:hypothetical protein
MKPKMHTLSSFLILAGLLLGGCASSISTQIAENTPISTPKPASPSQTEEATATQTEGSTATFTPEPTPTATTAEITPEPVSEAEPFKAWLSENIASRNYEELQKLMGSDFYFGMLHSEAGKETPEDAIRLLRGFFGDNHVEFVPSQEADSLLETDPLSYLGPDVKNPDYLLAKNVGTDGKDGAILYIAQKPDGSYYWYGLLTARGGFK